MVGFACRRQALLQVRWIALPTPSLNPLSRRPLWKPQAVSLPSSRLVRPFTAFPACRQQAAPADASSGERSNDGHPPNQLTTFQELSDHGIISSDITSTIIHQMGIHTMTDVQRMTINECLDGADVIAQAKTGTGKTIAFLMPLIQRLLRGPELRGPPRRGENVDDIRALVISPTRELAEQIAAEARKIVRKTPIKVQTAVGGTQKSYHLNLMQRQGCHILVATPGRVKDILSDSYTGVSLENIQTFILDEADRLLDIGFAPDIAEIQEYMPPRERKERQTLMFSATVPKAVVSLVRSTLRPDFKFVRTTPPDEAPTHASVPQLATFLNGLENEMPALLEFAQREIQKHQDDPAKHLPFKAIVYMNATMEVALAQSIFENMKPVGEDSRPRRMFANHPLEPCRIIEMHARLTQQQRTRNSELFRRAESAILFSSDVTARGMDFPNVSHIVQLGLPKTQEDYIHRLGRTGRAGKSGQGLLMLQQDERQKFRRMFGGGDFNIKLDDSLRAASLDMSQPAELPAELAKVMQMVESGVQATPNEVKQQAYRALIGALSQGGRDKQEVMDMLNRQAKYGWGMAEPPTLPSRFVDKLGLRRVQGLNVGESSRSDFGSRRDPFGDRRDPFGSRDGGRGGGGYGGGYGRGGFGGDRGGFGGDRRRNFGDRGRGY